MSPALVALIAVLTVIGWGGGEVIGHGVNRYLNRRYVKAWLTAERAWMRALATSRIEAGKPKRGPMPKRKVVTGCDCNDCRPAPDKSWTATEREAKKDRWTRGVPVETIIHTRLIATRTDLNGDVYTFYEDKMGGRGYMCYTTYRNGMLLTKETMYVGPRDSVTLHYGLDGRIVFTPGWK